MTLTLERLKELLYYDPETGVFTWLKSRGGGAKAGGRAGWVDNSKYIRIRVDGRMYLAQRLAWFYTYGRWPMNQMDHRDLCRSNNKLCNLREATQGQNQANRKVRRDSSTGVKGVFPSTNRTFVARIRHNGKMIHLGSFPTKELASVAYEIASEAYHKEYGRTT